MPATRASAILPDQFNTFGGLLKFLRRRAGLTQRELAIAADYSTSQISRLEHDDRPPDAAMLAARFVPALQLAGEPTWATRLLELAAVARASGVAVEVAPALTPRHNLPFQFTTFIGREGVLTKARRLLGSSRLATLTGPGGSGKTRLALELAAGVLARFPDGAWLVDLAPLADPALVAQAMASALAVREQPGQSILETLQTYLRRRTALIVVDNCEHLIGACAHLAEALLAACPNLRILATSREALDVPGETALAVPPLTVPDRAQKYSIDHLAELESVQLFVDRARAALPDFALTPANAPAVAQVCRQLDGMPLAIEMAAARVKLLRVEQIAERLNDRFELLTGGRRTALPRHRSLAAVLDWSYELLAEPERALLRRLAVFAGGWTLRAAERVCGDEPGRIGAAPVLDMLTGLVNKSLVVAQRQAGHEARYHCLETVREYALAKLVAAGEEQSTRRRHARYYRALAETAERAMPTSDELRWLDRMQVELDNLPAAVAWSYSPKGNMREGLRLASSLHDFWMTRARGALSEGLTWLEAGLAADHTVSPLVRAKALISAGWLAVASGGYARSEQHFEAGLAISRGVGDRLGLAWALCGLGYVAWNCGDHDRADSRQNDCRVIFHDVGDAFGQGCALYFLGEVARARGEYQTAHIYYAKSLEIAQKLGSPAALASVALDLAHLARAEGHDGQAIGLYMQALALNRELGDTSQVAECLMYLARLILAEGDTARARTLLAEAGNLLRDFGHRNKLNAYYLGEVGGLPWRKGGPTRRPRCSAPRGKRSRQLA